MPTVEERINNLETSDKLIMQEFVYVKANLNEMSQDLKDIKKELQYEHMSRSFVTVERFKNIEKLVYGMVSLILMGFVTYLVNFVMNG